MNPTMITAIAYLIAEAVVAGTSLATLMREVNRTGRVPPERWDAMVREMDREAARWWQERNKEAGAER